MSDEPIKHKNRKCYTSGELSHNKVLAQDQRRALWRAAQSRVKITTGAVEQGKDQSEYTQIKLKRIHMHCAHTVANMVKIIAIMHVHGCISVKHELPVQSSPVHQSGYVFGLSISSVRMVYSANALSRSKKAMNIDTF